VGVILYLGEQDAIHGESSTVRVSLSPRSPKQNKPVFYLIDSEPPEGKTLREEETLLAPERKSQWIFIPF
jgi:hypothetical protein